MCELLSYLFMVSTIVVYRLPFSTAMKKRRLCLTCLPWTLYYLWSSKTWLYDVYLIVNIIHAGLKWDLSLKNLNKNDQNILEVFPSDLINVQFISKLYFQHVLKSWNYNYDLVYILNWNRYPLENFSKSVYHRIYYWFGKKNFEFLTWKKFWKIEL